MNPTVKAKWVEALRSGKYEQDQGHLRTKDGFCCLGVLCDLYSKETGVPWVNDTIGNSTYGGQRGFPPPFVDEWAGFETLRVEIDGKVKTLDRHNDKGVKFDQIAQAIEEQL